MTVSVHWDLDITALSPISHKEETLGTTTMLRREKVFLPDGRVTEVPVVSGNSLRGVLRRLGEELLREVLGYEGELPLRVAHALRNGGSLSKTDVEGISGRRLAQLRELVPHVGVFGCAAGARTISGAIKVGKVRPVCEETRHLLDGLDHVGELPSVFRQVCLESYSHFADGEELSFEEAEGHGPLMRYEVEAFATGVQLRSWIRLEHAHPGEVAFLTDVLQEFARRGHLGARSGTGFGQIRVAASEPMKVTGKMPAPMNWREAMSSRRDEVMEVLQWIG